MTPASLVEAVTVTASRGAIESATPAVASVITADALASTPAPMLDDQLKSVPGFSLFRRSSSRVANPTTQGVTMRGLSASGASRSLVLVDGVPLNDAFGGWIYWDRVPQAALDRVEIVRGGSSDLYGANAVGGVIQILTLSPARASLRADAEIGFARTPRISLFGGGAHDAWSGFASGEWQTTDGYVIVEPQTGSVATERRICAARWTQPPIATTRRFTRAAAINRARGAPASAAASSPRAAATARPLTNNDTNARELVGDFSGTVAGGFWQARAYGGTQNYNQTFSAVTAVNSLRTSESLTQAQHVPSSNTGATAQWTRLAGRTTWSVGADTSRTEGKSEETTFTRNVATGSSANGGVQWETGAFGRVSFAVASDVTIVGALRADRWTSTPTNPAASVAVARRS